MKTRGKLARIDGAVGIILCSKDRRVDGWSEMWISYLPYYSRMKRDRQGPILCTYYVLCLYVICSV